MDGTGGWGGFPNFGGPYLPMMFNAHLIILSSLTKTHKFNGFIIHLVQCAIDLLTLSIWMGVSPMDSM